MLYFRLLLCLYAGGKPLAHAIRRWGEENYLRSQLLARKSIDKLIRDADEPAHALKRSLGPWSLTSLGIGAVIGSGIFTVIGTAISGEHFSTTSFINTPLADYLIRHTAMAGRPGAGPAIAISLVLVAVVCAFTGL